MKKNEDYVARFIQILYGPESNPIREVTSSYKDMVLGIDITFQIEGVEKTCQVKPLKFDNFKLSVAMLSQPFVLVVM